ncbi:MAG: class I SAM-dependent methyltransferase [Planctomycetaceae bacterium]|jgi:SAM-dependent methyltransferase|nr:class I SAM-dependent methyltransferase [Planctomycetaceae bacterium]MBX3419040.1 class I SAM-dependent methyltransferase [Pirellulaceae bacterium]HMO16096.1 class I SAM-dependent methyltransferase [Pirellulaceae bacterium]HMO94196.1 class I SAM-dependent methyltransferase [Pirellulaceae bacterium]HMP71253.1 class I SAM-dependent methyltransferase [Pirellulaceae bacterium]
MLEEKLSKMDGESSEVARDAVFWEPIASSRWGQYISSIEQQCIEFALRQTKIAGNALEIGAESGRWSKLLFDCGWQVTCTEINATALDVCHKRIPSAKCVLVDKESTQFPCPSNSMDLLLAIEVHELVEQEWFILESKRVLREGGLYVGVFQNVRSWRALIRNLKSDGESNFKHYTASYAPWRDAMRRQGFEMLKQVGCCWMPFGRMSNSSLIPAAVQIEKLLGLRRLYSISPWVVFVAKKITQ